MSTELEKQWIAAWRRAGPELERIRKEELRALNDSAGFKLLGRSCGQHPETGLVTFQAWMMRLLVRGLTQKND